MTNEEALAILCAGVAPDSKANDECIEICKKALKKQIPKKIIWKRFDSSGDPLPLPYCSTCGKSVMRSDYCDNCGQRLDWGEEK